VVCTDCLVVEGSRVRADLHNEWRVHKKASSHFQEAGSPSSHVIFPI